MSTITVMLPDDVLATVKKSPDEVAAEMRTAVAVSWYARGLVSQGRGAEIAGITRSEFIDVLAAHGVSASQETMEDIREALRRD
jgi:predicted HTH domain antitoxin